MSLTSVQTSIDAKEADRLISSHNIEGAIVYNDEGQKLGSIMTFMVDKLTGHVEYVVLSPDDLVDSESDYYPLPWQMLTFSAGQGGYVVNLDKATLENAPRYNRETQPTFDRAHVRQIYDYYGIPYSF